MEQNFIIECEKERRKGHIRAEKINFLFLDDGSMVYPTIMFDGYWEAMIDAIKKGEDMDELISLVFPEKFDHPIVKRKIIEFLKK